MVIIISSVQGPATFQYYDNLAFLKNGLDNDEIHFEGYVNVHEPDAFVYEGGRGYDFTRKARAKVREDMADWLGGTLPGLQLQDCRKIREAFDCIFNYYAYKGYLDHVGDERHESMQMLVFDDRDQPEYVAHVQFSSITKRNAEHGFTVNATLSCQRFTPFPLQQTALDDILQALQNLHVQ